MARFDLHLMVDWSARGVPSPRLPTKDAIWIGAARPSGMVEAPVYRRTRSAAMAWLEARIGAEREAGGRVLVGFDFPFGYPAGFAAHVTGRPEARAVWRWLRGAIEDGPDNASNRFAVAGRLNGMFGGVGPFWGRPAGLEVPGLPARGRERVRTPDHPAERRLVEGAVPRAQPVWKLFTTGSVGSQALLGLPRLEALARAVPGAQVWPFDTGLAVPEAPVVLAEIYPSLLAEAVRAAQHPGEITDAAQVRVLAAALAALDAQGGLGPLMTLPGLAGADRARAREEGWILGVGQEVALRQAAARAGPA
jgi:hypothetical protein